MELEKLAKIIAEVLNDDANEITLDTTFVDEFGADSLDVFQIIMGIEEEFDIEIPNEEAEKIVSVGDAVEAIKSALNYKWSDDIDRWEGAASQHLLYIRLKQKARNKMKQTKDLKELEGKIGYTFKDKTLFKQALTHSSYANEHRHEGLKDNERLEFLGDAVLEIISSEYLFYNYPDMAEGEMTKLRASIVCEPTLALCTHEISLGSYLFLGKGEERTGGRNRDSIVSDAMESVIGAIYLDGGFASAKEFIHKFILKDIEHKKLFYDSKTILQEIVQSDYKGKEIEYVLTGEIGPDHDKKFVVSLVVGDKTLGEGTGRTKKAAEQEAAYRAIIKLKGNA